MHLTMVKLIPMPEPTKMKRPGFPEKRSKTAGRQIKNDWLVAKSILIRMLVQLFSSDFWQVMQILFQKMLIDCTVSPTSFANLHYLFSLSSLRLHLEGEEQSIIPQSNFCE